MATFRAQRFSGFGHVALVLGTVSFLLLVTFLKNGMRFKPEQRPPARTSAVTLSAAPLYPWPVAQGLEPAEPKVAGAEVSEPLAPRGQPFKVR